MISSLGGFAQSAKALFVVTLASLSIGNNAESHVDGREILLISFVEEEDLSNWKPLNDGVMGGLSEGRLNRSPYGARWIGQTRLENSGGFSSIRGPWSTYDLSQVKTIRIRCRGTGGPFKLTMERSKNWWMPYAFAEINPSSAWSEIAIRVEDLKWSQAFTGDIPLQPAASSLGDVIRLGMMKYDGTAQAFDLEIAWISFER